MSPFGTPRRFAALPKFESDRSKSGHEDQLANFGRWRRRTHRGSCDCPP